MREYERRALDEEAHMGDFAVVVQDQSPSLLR